VHLAAPAAVNRTYLSNLEKGARYPVLEIIAKLATVLEVEPAGLLRVFSGLRFKRRNGS
jgi:transcriptional regulator with XRE-family HTH domain